MDFSQALLQYGTLKRHSNTVPLSYFLKKNKSNAANPKKSQNPTNPNSKNKKILLILIQLKKFLKY
jgi:hypothetical protein